MKHLVDLSHHQTITDWKKLNDSVDGIIHKVTEGTGYLDPTWKSRKDKILVPRGMYHFSKYGNFQAEADWFIKNLPELKEGDFLCLDAESGESREWCKNWLRYVEEKTGLIPFVYTHPDKWEYDLYNPLWVPRYGTNSGKMETNYPPKLGPYKKYTIWQYTSNGTIPGVDGRVDLNVADGFEEYIKKAPMQTPPTPMQTPVEVTPEPQNAPTSPVTQETVQTPYYGSYTAKPELNEDGTIKIYSPWEELKQLIIKLIKKIWERLS